MYKVGCTDRDKLEIKKLHNIGRNTSEISAITRVTKAHVEAVVVQVKNGTLLQTVKTTANKAAAAKKKKKKTKPAQEPATASNEPIGDSAAQADLEV